MSQLNLLVIFHLKQISLLLFFIVSLSFSHSLGSIHNVKCNEEVILDVYLSTTNFTFPLTANNPFHNKETLFFTVKTWNGKKSRYLDGRSRQKAKGIPEILFYFLKKRQVKVILVSSFSFFLIYIEEKAQPKEKNSPSD